MKIVFNFFLITSMIYLISCSDSAKSNYNEQNEQVELTNQQTEKGVLNQSQIIPDQSQPVQNQIETNNNSGVVLNPPHGEPGHDCAVQVGAPLPSQPQNSTQQQNNPVQMNATPTDNANSKGSVAGINPPHGEPGHDCTIAVGAPLKK